MTLKHYDMRVAKIAIFDGVQNFYLGFMLLASSVAVGVIAV
jgi:hypothetical protein